MNEPLLLVSNTGCEVDAVDIVTKMMQSGDMISSEPQWPSGARRRHRLPSSLNRTLRHWGRERCWPEQLHPEIRSYTLVGRAWRPSCRPGSLANGDPCEDIFHWLRINRAPLDKQCRGAVASMLCITASQQGYALAADSARLHQALVAEREAATASTKHHSSRPLQFYGPQQSAWEETTVFHITPN